MDMSRQCRAMSTLQAFYELKSEVREYFDAKKVIPKIGGKRPGKKCVGKSGKGSYIAADKKCKEHYSESGKLTEEGRASAQELAGKVRARKGMAPIEKAAPAPVKLSGTIKNSDSVYVYENGQLRRLNKTKASNKYSKISAELPEGAIVKLKGFYASQFDKKPLEDGWYTVTSKGLKPTHPPKVNEKPVYLHEIYQELAEGKHYQG
jgi:hypothetical protein